MIFMGICPSDATVPATSRAAVAGISLQSMWRICLKVCGVDIDFVGNGPLLIGRRKCLERATLPHTGVSCRLGFPTLVDLPPSCTHARTHALTHADVEGLTDDHTLSPRSCSPLSCFACSRRELPRDCHHRCLWCTVAHRST
jgi:hypothetical protein